MIKSIKPLLKNIIITWFIVLIGSLILVGALNLVVADADYERWESYNEINM